MGPFGLDAPYAAWKTAPLFYLNDSCGRFMSDAFNLEGLTLTPHTREAFAKDGIVAPTEVQAAAIPLILAKREVAIQSGTGTGKTLAYVLPLLQMASAEPSFRAVVLAPSPELALQILRNVEEYKEAHVTCTGLTGSGNPQRQRDKLKKHPQIMVGTPGRVLELILSKKIKTAQIAVLVLDEVDEILFEKNDEQLRDICSRPEFTAQILCASATFGSRALSFMQKCMAADRVTTEVRDTPHTDNIAHVIVPFSQQRKELALLSLLKAEKIKRAIVFVNKLYNVGHLFRVLEEAQVPVASMSGERDKQSREQAMRALRGKQGCILVATDAAARGLDVKHLDHVIHYEMARDVPTYLHRAGRTGRAGQTGTSLAMVAPNEQHLVRLCEKELGVRFVHRKS